MEELSGETVEGRFRELYVDQGSAYDVRYVMYRRPNEENSHFILPWAEHPQLFQPAMPFCSPAPSQMAQHQDSMIRLAHVLCRHGGYMVATK